MATNAGATVANVVESAAIVPESNETRYDQVELITNRGIRVDGSSGESQEDVLDGAGRDDEEQRRRMEKAKRKAARGERERRPLTLFHRLVRYGNDNFNNICSALSPLLILLAYGANSMYFSPQHDDLFPDGSIIRKLQGIINCTALALEGNRHPGQ
jgi:hypothetical protein